MSSATNPGQALGTPNVYGGKTSIEGFSDGIAHAFSYGFVSGFRARANSPLGMSILVGGETDDDNRPTKDVVIVKNDSTDDRYVVFNKSNAPIEVIIPTAPTVNSRIDAVVVYRDMAAAGDGDVTDNPSSVGIAVVEGAVAATPSNPSDSQIRAVIPNGTQACYTTICRVRVSAGVTTISDSNITDARQHSYLNNNVVPDNIARMTDVDNIQDDIDGLIKSSSTTVDFGYAKQATLTRVGNTVFCKTSGGNGKPTAGTWVDTRIKCPQGYRPSHHTAITGILPGGAGACTWIQTIAPGNVSMQMMVCGDLNNSSNDYQGVGSWHTNDT